MISAIVRGRTWAWWVWEKEQSRPTSKHGAVVEGANNHIIIYIWAQWVQRDPEGEAEQVAVRAPGPESRKAVSDTPARAPIVAYLLHLIHVIL